MIITDGFVSFELGILAAIHNISCPFLDTVMKAVTFTGNWGLIWIVLAVVLMCFRKTRKCGFAVAVALILSVVLNNLLLKNLIGRLRPFQIDTSISLIIDPPSEYSFPSGHTLSGFAAATAIWFCNRNAAGISAVIWAALIGFSRLYLQVHFPSDVIGGAVIGIVFGIAAILIVNNVYKYYDKKHEMRN